MVNVLASVSTFRGVQEADLSRLWETGTTLQLRDEQTIFTRGDPAGGLYLMLSGTVRISTLGASGKRIIVEIFEQGDLFGELAAIDGGVRTADATAIGPVELLAMPAAKFRDLLAASAPLANNLLRMATERLRRTIAELVLEATSVFASETASVAILCAPPVDRVAE